MKDTQIDHKSYASKVRSMTYEQLRWTIQDCREAVRANPTGHKAGYYADEISYCSMELARRSK